MGGQDNRASRVFVFDALLATSGLSVFREHPEPKALECLRGLVGGLVTYEHVVWTNSDPKRTMARPGFEISILYEEGWKEFIEPLRFRQQDEVDWSAEANGFVERFKVEANSTLLKVTAQWLYENRALHEPEVDGDLGSTFETTVASYTADDLRKIRRFGEKLGFQDEALTRYTCTMVQKHPDRMIDLLNERFNEFQFEAATHPARELRNVTWRPAAITGRILVENWLNVERISRLTELGTRVTHARDAWMGCDLGRIGSGDIIHKEFREEWLMSWQAFCVEVGLSPEYADLGLRKHAEFALKLYMNAKWPGSSVALDLAKNSLASADTRRRWDADHRQDSKEESDFRRRLGATYRRGRQSVLAPDLWPMFGSPFPKGLERLLRRTLSAVIQTSFGRS